MKEAGVREFRDHASRYIGGDEPVAVTNHGRTVGYFIPVRRPDDAERRQLLADLDRVVHRMLEESGQDEEQLAQELSNWAS